VVQRVAVLLAAYNGIKWIEEQVSTILNQENVFVHVFISVDLSSDNTYERCMRLAEISQNITVLKYGERFGGAASNFYRLIKDVDFSTFEYVALADQDDIWLDDKLITACTRIRKEELAAYSGNVLAFWIDGRERLIDKAQPQREYDYLFEAAGPGCSYVLRTEPLFEFKKLLISHWQQANQVALHDWFIYAFFRENGYQWFIDSEYKLRYRQHDDNQVGVNKGWRAAIKRLKLFKNSWYKQQVVLISELIDIKNINFDSRWIVLKNIRKLRRRWQDRAILFILVLAGFY
jgi:rhamnosyltransferase